MFVTSAASVTGAPLSRPNPTAPWPEAPQAAPAQRLSKASWCNGRTAFGTLLVLVAVLAGALFLERAQRLVPLYAAARDLPAGVPLARGDLEVVRARLPATSLRNYLRPGSSSPYTGRLLASALRRHALVPADAVVMQTRADLVEFPVKADPADIAQGLAPGDVVEVLAASTDGVRRGRAVVLVDAAEVTRVLRDGGGIAAGDREDGVQVRVPADRVAAMAAAVATARIFVVKAPPATLPGAPGVTAS